MFQFALLTDIILEWINKSQALCRYHLKLQIHGDNHRQRPIADTINITTFSTGQIMLMSWRYQRTKAGSYLTLLLFFGNLLRLLFEFLSCITCETDETCAKKKYGCWYRNRNHQGAICVETRAYTVVGNKCCG